MDFCLVELGDTEQNKVKRGGMINILIIPPRNTYLQAISLILDHWLERSCIRNLPVSQTRPFDCPVRSFDD